MLGRRPQRLDHLPGQDDIGVLIGKSGPELGKLSLGGRNLIVGRGLSGDAATDNRRRNPHLLLQGVSLSERIFQLHFEIADGDSGAIEP